jgi:hypothetical protein
MGAGRPGLPPGPHLQTVGGARKSGTLSVGQGACAA